MGHLGELITVMGVKLLINIALIILIHNKVTVRMGKPWWVGATTFVSCVVIENIIIIAYYYYKFTHGG